MKKYSRLRAVVDLDAVMYNMEMMRANLDKDMKMIAVIKTDGYGHGAVPIALMLEPEEYIWGYAVALLEEGLLLRKAGIKKPILCLGCIFPDQFEEMIEGEIRMTCYSEEIAKLVSETAVRMGKTAYLHIKVDTGMSRLGFAVNQESVEEILRIQKLAGLTLEGMFTHFARADERDKTSMHQAFEKYQWLRNELEGKGLNFAYYHVSNSAGIIDSPHLHSNLVRAGISIYGLYPSEEVEKTAVPLKPALSLLAHVTHVKWIEKGTEISYGGTFTAPERMRIATIPAGYGDGYPRSLSGKGYVLIRGQKAPILGRVCMDQFMVDVTHIPEVQFGDQVTLVGTDGEENLPVEVLSELSGRFNYEFVCDINKRVPREYIKGGKVVDQRDYF
ncbi:alanine racemase [Roseburia hominis]